MVLFNKKEDCCGCSACKSICPKSAIKMLPDNEGFLYPVIDDKLCINCGICEKVCAFKNGYSTADNFEEPFVYAVRHKNIHEVETSRSGAMFIAISDYVLENNGAIYGVGYTDYFRVVHKRAKTKQERNEFKGSKYVQSDINITFYLIKKDLQNGMMALFCGTPCQTAGLYSFLKNINTDKLYVCDIICYGVPSPLVWRDYLNYLKVRYKDRINVFNFRDKCKGWKSHNESFVLQSTHKKILKKTFSILFCQNIILRPSCGFCKFNNFRRPSDITLGDYWGLEKISSTFNADGKGVSLVLINTQKGMEIFNLIKKNILYLESCVEKCLQPRLQYPTKPSLLREKYWNEYKKYGFKFVAKKYSDLEQIRILKIIKLCSLKKIWKTITKQY